MLPNAITPKTSRLTVQAFSGLDRRLRPADGSCAALENFWGGSYPVLETRPARGLVTTLVQPGGMTARDCLCYVDGSVLYLNGYGVDLGLSSARPKQLVSMGAFLIIFPDKKYINTADLSDYGALEQRFTAASGATLTLCGRDGAAYSLITADVEPEDVAPGALWLEPSAPCLRRYTAGGWVEETETCVRISASGAGAGFAAGDGVEISGAAVSSLNGTFVLEDAGEDFLLVRAMLPCAERTQTTALTVARTVPDLDFVVECGNRLWGCRYGMENGRAVNEIACCKLGDFRNWGCYAGLSTDSWAASRGADGPFTGAITFQGSPIFFRENCLERVYPAADGAHRITTQQAAGVQKNCGGSLAVVGGAVYYRSLAGVMAYDGAQPVCVSERLGTAGCLSACGGALGADYYLCEQVGEEEFSLLQLDTSRGFWYRQDSLAVTAFAACGWELYALTADGRLLSLTGGEGELGEEPLAWSMETGELGLDLPENKYLSRLRLRCSLAGTMQAQVRCDGETAWRSAGTVSSLGLRSFTLPILPRRCDRMRLRLSGTGAFRLYSLSCILEEGSDAP